MNNSLNRLLAGTIATLKSEIIPRLDDEFARGQAYAIIDLINNLQPRIDWLITPLYEEVRAQRQLLEQLQAVFATASIRIPITLQAAVIEPGMPAHALEQLRNALDNQICMAIDWLAQRRAQLPPELFAPADALLKQHLRTSIKRETNMTAKPLFGEIAKG